MSDSGDGVRKACPRGYGGIHPARGFIDLRQRRPGLPPADGVSGNLPASLTS